MLWGIFGFHLYYMPVCCGTGQKCGRELLIQRDTCFAVWQVTSSTSLAPDPYSG